MNNDYTSVRIQRTTSDDLSHVRELMQMIDKRRYSKDEVIRHMMDFILENDVDLKHINNVIRWNKDRGRVTQLRG